MKNLLFCILAFFCFTSVVEAQGAPPPLTQGNLGKIPRYNLLYGHSNCYDESTRIWFTAPNRGTEFWVELWNDKPYRPTVGWVALGLKRWSIPLTIGPNNQTCNLLTTIDLFFVVNMTDPNNPNRSGYGRMKLFDIPTHPVLVGVNFFAQGGFRADHFENEGFSKGVHLVIQ